jgi:tetratricopeptide (TPR) repeat protein
MMFLSDRRDDLAGGSARHAVRHRVRWAGLRAALALLPIGGLQAAETVLFNESAAHQCYLAALRGADAREVDICNAALQHQSLKSADFAATLSNRGLLLARSGRYEDALRDHDRAIQSSPDLASLYINRSNTYTRAQRFDEAMGDLDQAIEIAGRPQPAATPVPRVARAVGRQRRRPRAGGGCAGLTAPVPVPDTASQLAVAHYNRALLYQRRGDLGAALADAVRARDHAPDRPGYRDYVAELERQRSPASRDGAAGSAAPGSSAPEAGNPAPGN